MPTALKARLKPAKHRGVVKPQVGWSIESSEKRANLRRIKRRFHLCPRWPSCPDISSASLSQAPFPLMPLFASLGCTYQLIKTHQGLTSSVPGPQLWRLHLKETIRVSFQDVDRVSVNLPSGNSCPCHLWAWSRTSCPFSCQRFVGSSGHRPILLLRCIWYLEQCIWYLGYVGFSWQ